MSRGRVIVVLALLALGASRVLAQQPMQSVVGVVRDSSGAPLAGAEVLIGIRRAETNPQGAFRIDSLRPGRYNVTVRLIGFNPVRSRLAVVESEPTQVEYLLLQAPALLPTMIVEGHRAGIFGSVGDTGYRAIIGARVQIVGPHSGEVRSDSVGHFAFPATLGGQYLVRVTFPGYTERRFLVELKKGSGRELGVLLAPFRDRPSQADDVALEEVGKRLAAGLRRERMISPDLERYSSMPLCEVPQIRAEIGRDLSVPILFVLNGTSADKNADLGRLCAWRADEVEFVEFGVDVCRDVTLTLPQLVGIWCSGRSRNVPRSMMGSGQRIATQAAGMRYVVIWEKK